MIEKTVQMKPIGDREFEVNAFMDLNTAKELHQMLGQVFVLQSVSWQKGDEAKLCFVPGNGMAVVKDGEETVGTSCRD